MWKLYGPDIVLHTQYKVRLVWSFIYRTFFFSIKFIKKKGKTFTIQACEPIELSLSTILHVTILYDFSVQYYSPLQVCSIPRSKAQPVVTFRVTSLSVLSRESDENQLCLIHLPCVISSCPEPQPVRP